MTGRVSSTIIRRVWRNSNEVCAFKAEALICPRWLVWKTKMVANASEICLLNLPMWKLQKKIRTGNFARLERVLLNYKLRLFPIKTPTVTLSTCTAYKSVQWKILFYKVIFEQELSLYRCVTFFFNNIIKSYIPLRCIYTIHTIQIYVKYNTNFYLNYHWFKWFYTRTFFL